ncbi:hypothetical protein [Cumulibacter soli]|uniref:hypothetical protein n=1 Tax=Cumulibacter soli TaxID=2546344 RepID=UPI0010680203|nr:hypothetical protein [Cumulibacter soli]
MEQLRSAARRAVDWLCEPGEPVTVLTSGANGRVPDGAALNAAAYGLSYRGQLGAGGPRGPELVPQTPGLLVASYLLDGHPAHGIEISSQQTFMNEPDFDANFILVCGGGSARRRDGAPGYIDERAVPHDDALAGLIANADAAALGTADVDLADELLDDLARPLAVAARLVARWKHPVSGRVDSYEAPFGVANILARWWTHA